MLDHKMYGAPIRAQSTAGNQVSATATALSNNQPVTIRNQMQPLLHEHSLQQSQPAFNAASSRTSAHNKEQLSLYRSSDMADLNQSPQPQHMQHHHHQQQQQQQQQQEQQQDQKLLSNRHYVNQLLANGQHQQFSQFAQNQNIAQNVCVASNSINNNVVQASSGSHNVAPNNNDSTLSFALDEIGAIINSKDFEELLAEAKNTTPSQQNFPFQSASTIPLQLQQVNNTDATGAYQVEDAQQSASTTPRSQSQATNERQYMTPVDESSVDNRLNDHDYYQNDQETLDQQRRTQNDRGSDDRQSTLQYDANHFEANNLAQAQQVQHQRQGMDQQLELRQPQHVEHLMQHRNQINYTHTKVNDVSTNQQHNSSDRQAIGQCEDNKPNHNNQQQQLDLLPLMAPIDGCKPYVEIVEHPAKCALRFRYKCEGRSAGSLPGVNSTVDHKTYPSIRINNHVGRSVVVISCVTKDAPYKAHPHNIVGKEGCKKGVCTIVLNNDPNTVRSFSIGIQCVKRKDVEESLTLRKSINVDPFRNGFAHKSCPSNIDLNVVRLCFQVFIEGSTPNKCDVPLVPVVSDPIHDKKAMSELVITKLSHCSAPATGGREIILLCDRISKDDIKVRFYQEKDGKLIWETYTDIAPTDVHKQVAICLKTPKYYNENITQPVMARIQLKRVSDNQFSEPRLFQFLPCESDEDIILRKKRKIEWVNMMS